MKLRPCYTLLVCMLAAATTQASSVSYSDATPSCSVAQVDLYNRVTAQVGDFDARDLDGHYIGSYFADGIFWRNHVPIDIYKRTLCAVQHHYEFYDDLFSGDEADSNPFVVPDAAHSGFIWNAVNWGYTDSDDLHTCSGAKCVEIEITHDQAYANNTWFPHAAGEFTELYSPLNGKSLCTYGPWIADDGHGGRPEIHPSEAIWWKDAVSGDQTEDLRVLLMQDDSNRFDRRVDFHPDMPSSVYPWSSYPRTHVLRKAFRIAASQFFTSYMHLHELRARYIRTGEFYWSGDVGYEHTLNYNGRPLLSVLEHQPDSNLTVGFDTDPGSSSVWDPCRRSDGSLQGYVTVRTGFGINDRGGEGYQEIALVSSNSPIDAPPKALSTDVTQLPNQSIRRTRLDPASLRWEADGKRLSLFGDLLLELAPKSALQSVHDGAGQKVDVALEASDRADAQQVRARRVDLGKEQRMTLDFASGETATGKLQGLALTTLLEARPESGIVVELGSHAAWSQFLARVGASGNAPRPAEFVHLARWSVAATPVFAALKHGRASLEDELKVAEWLNRKLAEGDAAGVPIDRLVSELHWTLATGRLAELGVAQSPWQRKVAFENANALVQVSLEVKLQDRMGGSQTSHQRVYSHALIGEPEQLNRLVRELLVSMEGPATTGIDGGAVQEVESIAPAAVAHRVFALQSQRFVADGLVQADEFAALLKLARQANDGSGSE